MGQCQICGEKTNRIYGSEGYYCEKCYNKLEQQRILQRYEKEKINSVSDLIKGGWSAETISELFWIHLGRYQKYPNQKSWDVLYTTFAWAKHSDHALSNSMRHALEWCKIDLLSDNLKDLPKDYEF